MVNEADIIKLLRNGEPLPVEGVLKLGDKPFNSLKNPIRKRAFWRALKRGELWAITSYSQKQINSAMSRMANHFNKIIYDTYCPENMVYITWPFNVDSKNK